MLYPVTKTNYGVLFKSCLAVLGFLCTAMAAFSQPVNDDCANASTIPVSNNGYGLGSFTSSTNDISAATIQAGEGFAPAILVAGQNKKSMWYKFTIATTRAVRVTLTQPGTVIRAGDAGFAVYKAANCLPSGAQISTRLTPIGTFGNTFHPCVDSGVYYIQVSGNNNANGPLSIELELANPTALYDTPGGAYQFGTVNPHNYLVDYLMSCQSVDNDAERCGSLANSVQYHKSSWHTFKTPAYFDYLAVLLSKPGGGYYVNSNTDKKFGYTLYKGDAVADPLTSLVAVGGCDSLETNGYYAAYKMYRCGELEPNTTYTIQLFAHETFNDEIRLGISVGGTAPTQAPRPVAAGFPASNDFGTLVSTPSGPAATRTDFLACNSRLSTTFCNPSLPAAGLNFAGKKYSLGTFFRFTLAATSSINFLAEGASPTTCGPDLLVRVFRQDITGNCADLDTVNLVGSFLRTADLDCLPPGNYTVQVLGTDTVLPYTSFHYNTTNTSSARCLSSNLGSKISFRLRAYSRQAINHFSLAQAGAFDTINRTGNGMAPLVSGTTYQARPDTFACANTVLPPDTTCSPGNTKAMYREFAVADSGIVTLTALDWYHQYKLYLGDANTLAASQNAFAYPDRLTGLTPQSLCLNYTTSCTYKNVCVVPGTYTFATFGKEDDIGRTDRPSIGFQIVTTRHFTPAQAQDMGSILDSVPATGGSKKSDIDYFSCKDNAVPVNAYMPCNISGKPATKAIYRQFYLKEEALVSITSNNSCGFGTGVRTLFYGKATDGLTGLSPVGGRWNCFSSSSSNGCDLLPPGWYTVVSYGSGPTYANPLQNVNQDGMYGSYVGQKDEFTITVTVCASPKFNRPYKASVNATGQPHLIQWKARTGSTAAFPRTDTTYALPTENFNCSNDTPFVLHPVIACDTTMRKVVYYVFRTTQESYLEISTGSHWAVIYAGDVRTDSAAMAAATPVQPCVKGNTRIQLCSLPAGTYTLVIFAPSTASCSSVSPRIYIDRTGQSRFDHAANAYDFGVVPPDSVWHRGKPGDVNPYDPQRAPSNDFFYCSAGSQPSDPTNAKCMSDDIYNMYDPSKKYMYEGNAGGSVDIVRRNLWYTFVVDKPGRVYVKVENKTPGKQAPYRFAVFRSDVDGSLAYSAIVASGQVDSTIAQGLTLVGHNGWPNYCNAIDEGINFYRDPCTQFEPQRYYLLVENRNPYAYYSSDLMNPANQLEVAVLIDSINIVPTKYDHYYKAYDFGTIGAGTHLGGTDNFSCATRGAKDPISGNGGCTKTLWYKFTSTVTGNVRYRIKAKGEIKYNSSSIQLFQETTPGDSTSAGLIYRGGSSFRGSDNTWWSQHCVSPGTWYLVLPGCNQVNEYVFPEIELVEQEGDFCSRPAVVTMSGAGTATANTIINCHTIGTDYGEFNPTLTCPANALTGKYKSSWFRLDVTGNDTVDVTTFISENTNVLPADIKYRMMTGSCGAMQEQSCVQDAQTQNTYKCLAAGSYYFQVFVPTTTTPTGSTSVTGDISLHLSAIKHVDTCAPVKNCLATANFIPQFDCSTDSAVRFVNYSTYGSSIQYQWDFGYGGQKSQEVSPLFSYPRLATDQTYQVTLNVTNPACGGSDAVTIPVLVPGRPRFTLGLDTSLCHGGNLVLNATSWPGSTYKWNTNATTPTITTTGTGARTYWVSVTYNGCTTTDTIRVYVNTIMGRNQTKILCGDSVQLVSTRNQQEVHQWSTGETLPSIYAKTPGRYYNMITWNGCAITDTFDVVETVYPFNTLDTAVCLKQPYRINAMVDGAAGYLWQNNSNSSYFNATVPGIYWVQVSFGSCSIRDTITISETQPIMQVSQATFCSGQVYTLPSGQTVSTPGIFRDTIRYSAGCDSLITAIDLSLADVKETTLQHSICAGQNFPLPWGATVNTPGVYSNVIKGISGCDSIRNTVVLSVNDVERKDAMATICAGESYTLPSGRVVRTTGTYSDTLRYAAGCDSVVATVNLVVRTVAIKAMQVAICEGEAYTLPSGMSVTSAGTYTDTLRYAAGCDSLLLTVHLTEKKATQQILSASVCEGRSYALPSGTIVSAPGLYSDTLRYQSGCDSVVTAVTLTTLTVKHAALSASICSNAFYTLPSGRRVNQLGIYNDTLLSSAGCDSLVTVLNLMVQAPATRATSATICQGQSYTMPSGVVLSRAGLYTDTLRTTTGCDSLVTQLTLTVLTKPPFTVQPSSPAVCSGDSVLLTATGGDSYLWSPVSNMSSPVTAATYVYPTTTTTYKVVMSHNGCSMKDSVYTTVTVHQKPVIHLSKTNDIDCVLGSSTLKATGAAQYLWSPATLVSNAASASPVARLRETTTFHVQATSAAGCRAEDSIQVKVIPGNSESGYLVPSAFTPNNDGKNDCFGVPHWGAVSGFKLYVYNRLGQLLFYTTDPSQCWDGTYGGKKVEIDTYVYQVIATTICGPVYRKGTFVLIR